MAAAAPSTKPMAPVGSPVITYDSLDFDGCVNNDENPLLENAHLISWIAEAGGYVMCGSARQAPEVDSLNNERHHNGCAYDVIELFAVVTGVEPIKTLLADIDNDCDPGTAWRTKDRSLLCFIDQYKLRLLYVQIHMAFAHHQEHHGGAPMRFRFVDDRRDILNALSRFFSSEAGRKLVPEGVVIELWHHGDDTVPRAAHFEFYDRMDLVAELSSGTGKFNPNYGKDSLGIFAACGVPMPTDLHATLVPEDFDEERFNAYCRGEIPEITIDGVCALVDAAYAVSVPAAIASATSAEQVGAVAAPAGVEGVISQSPPSAALALGAVGALDPDEAFAALNADA